MNDKSFQVIFFLLIISLVSDVYGLYTIARHSENFLIYNVLTLIQSLSIYYFFFLNIQSSLFRKILLLVTLTYFGAWFFYFLKFGNIGYFNDIDNVANITILIICIYYYYEQIIKDNAAFVYNKPQFWIVTAFFIYSSGIFFLFLYLPSLNSLEQEKYYSLNYLFVIIRTILLSASMWMKDDTGNMNRTFNLT